MFRILLILAFSATPAFGQTLSADQNSALAQASPSVPIDRDEAVKLGMEALAEKGVIFDAVSSEARAYCGEYEGKNVWRVGFYPKHIGEPVRTPVTLIIDGEEVETMRVQPVFPVHVKEVMVSKSDGNIIDPRSDQSSKAFPTSE